MTAPLRLLVVEDSEDDYLLVKLFLGIAGYDVHARRVESRAELLDALRRPWDLLVVDFRLPSLGGPEAIALARAAAPGMPVLAVSGTAEDAHAAMLGAGAHAFLEKNDLGDRVGAVVAGLLADARGEG